MRIRRILESVVIPIALAYIGYFAWRLAMALLRGAGHTYAVVSTTVVFNTILLVFGSGFFSGVAAVILLRKNKWRNRWISYGAMSLLSLLGALLVFIIEINRPQEAAFSEFASTAMLFNRVPFWIIAIGFWIPLLFAIYIGRKRPAQIGNNQMKLPRTTIYMHLENEGTDVWRPVEAVMIGGEFRIVTEPPEGESWQFPSDSRVVCETRKVEGKEILVATRLAPYKTEIILKEDGFTLRSAKKEDFVLFSDVSVIRAYKMDLFAYDEICVLFERDKDKPVEVTEEALGFSNLMKQVVSRFAGSDPHWFEKVLQPPFALCPTIIWEKEPYSQPKTASTQE